MSAFAKNGAVWKSLISEIEKIDKEAEFTNRDLVAEGKGCADALELFRFHEALNLELMGRRDLDYAQRMLEQKQIMIMADEAMRRDRVARGLPADPNL